MLFFYWDLNYRSVWEGMIDKGHRRQAVQTFLSCNLKTLPVYMEGRSNKFPLCKQSKLIYHYCLLIKGEKIHLEKLLNRKRRWNTVYVNISKVNKWSFVRHIMFRFLFFLRIIPLTVVINFFGTRGQCAYVNHAWRYEVELRWRCGGPVS